MTRAPLRADGSRDPDFHSVQPTRVIPRSRGLRSIARGNDILPATWEHRGDPVSFTALHYDKRTRRLFVSGDFTHLDRIPRRGLAALGMRRPWTFREWARERLPSAPQRAEQDPDQDGVSNLHEYAVGSDPNIADNPPHLQVLRNNPPCFCLKLNPDAVDIDYVLETSTDLRKWHAADESVVSSTIENDLLTWSFNDSTPATFVRVRFIESEPQP